MNEECEITRTGVSGEIVVRSVFGTEKMPVAAKDALIRAAYDRAEQRRGELVSLAATGSDGTLATAPLDALRELKKAVKADDDTAKAWDESLRDDLLTRSGFKPVAVQLRGAKARIDPASVRGKFAEIIKEIDAAIEAQTPPKPRHTYVLQVECDDAALKKIETAMKNAGAEWRIAAPQSDRAFEAIGKWFDENGQK